MLRGLDGNFERVGLDPNGETVRKCDLDLAPEAPWRCPDNCASFEPRMADVNWSHGTLVTPPVTLPDTPTF